MPNLGAGAEAVAVTAGQWIFAIALAVACLVALALASLWAGPVAVVGGVAYLLWGGPLRRGERERGLE
jgi:threonine/homoserine/homoserine lactone efflux protein